MKPLIRTNRNKNCTKMFLRGHLMWITPFDSKFILGQTSKHSVFSPADTHSWETGAQVRTCQKCFFTRMLPANVGANSAWQIFNI